jgi:outer membrane protein assembly factor BamB
MRWLLLTLVVMLPATGRAADWPQWMGPHRDGVWRETDLIEKFPAGGPKVSWEAKVGQGYAGPAVAGGKVFVLERTEEPGQPQPANAFDTKVEQVGVEALACFDQATGKELWRKSYPCRYRISYNAGPRCTPTVDGDRVYTLGAMGDLVCRNVADGAAVWQLNFVKDMGATVPPWGFSAHPLVDGNNLICLAGGSDGRLVVALDKLTGKEVWRSLSFDSGDFGYASPVIHTLNGVRTLLIWHPKALNGLDPTTGKKLWSVPMNIKFALTAPLIRVQGNRVFTTSFYDGSQMVEVTPDGPKVLWKSKAKGEKPNQTTDLSSIISTPLWKGDTIYGVDSYGELRAIDAATGKRLWATMKATRGPLTPENVAGRETPSETQPWSERWGNAFLIENGDRTVLFNEQGVLIFAKLTRAGYEELDRAQILQPTNRLAGRPVVWMHPAFADGHVYARNDTKLVAIDLRK